MDVGVYVDKARSLYQQLDKMEYENRTSPAAEVLYDWDQGPTEFLPVVTAICNGRNSAGS